jgi:hypothetical protein
MNLDFPATHSMDTVWFAVDKAGQVAMFDSGETGPVPQGEDNDLREELWQLWALPDAIQDGDWDLDVLCDERGAYYFFCEDAYGNDPVGCYIRSNAPEVPLHIDQLPPGLREGCREVSFDFRFDQVERFQLLEHVPSVLYDPDSVAYCCDDDKTVKPIPGKEDEFPAFVRAFQQEEPEAASKLIFDGPSE